MSSFSTQAQRGSIQPAATLLYAKNAMERQTDGQRLGTGTTLIYGNDSVEWIKKQDGIANIDTAFVIF